MNRQQIVTLITNVIDSDTDVKWLDVMPSDIAEHIVTLLEENQVLKNDS